MLACGGCRRFVRPVDVACPFCGASLPTTAAPLAMSLALGVMLGACGPSVAFDGDTGGSTTGNMTTSASSTVTATVGSATDDVPPDPSLPSTASTTAADSTTFDEDDIDGDGGCVFYGCPPDGGDTTFECDLWAQDCPVGEKCMPWANDGGSIWNATRCSPIDADPGAPGDPCTVEGSAVSGIDDCELGAMCFSVDDATNMGECVALCAGSRAQPLCVDPANGCSISSDGVLNLCLPTCMPLMPECDRGDGCYPVADQFLCLPDESDAGGGVSDPCEWLNACDVGLVCASADVVPECVSSGCCAPYCSLAGGDTPCIDTLGPETTCVAWFEDGQAPPGFEDLGVCGLPS